MELLERIFIKLEQSENKYHELMDAEISTDVVEITRKEAQVEILQDILRQNGSLEEYHKWFIKRHTNITKKNFVFSILQVFANYSDEITNTRTSRLKEVAENILKLENINIGQLKNVFNILINVEPEELEIATNLLSDLYYIISYDYNLTKVCKITLENQATPGNIQLFKQYVNGCDLLGIPGGQKYPNGLEKLKSEIVRLEETHLRDPYRGVVRKWYNKRQGMECVIDTPNNQYVFLVPQLKEIIIHESNILHTSLALQLDEYVQGKLIYLLMHNAKNPAIPLVNIVIDTKTEKVLYQVQSGFRPVDEDMKRAINQYFATHNIAYYCAMHL